MSTLLFVPATEDRKYQKANQLPCQGIILDLEDAVHTTQKASARENVSKIVKQYRNPNKQLYVRINSLDTPYWKDDLQAVLPLHVDGVVVPKAELNLSILDDYLDQLEAHFDLPKTKLLLILETAKAVTDMEKVLASSPRVDCSAIGMADLAADLGTSWEDLCATEPVLLRSAREQLALVSRKLGLSAPWDSVYMKIEDQAGFLADVEFGKRLGYQGKHVIHPSQIDVVNEIYRITEEQYDRAKAILETMQQQGAAQVDGLLIDEPVVKRARQIVQKYEEALQS